MGEIVADGPCPRCKENGRDSQNNHLILFSDGNGYCNKCGYIQRGGDNTKQSTTKKPIMKTHIETLEHIQSSFPIVAIPTRGLTKETCEYFGIRCSLSESDRSIEKIYSPIHRNGELVSYHKKDLTLDKGDPFHFSTTGGKGTAKNPDLFGESVCPKTAKKLIVVEGQMDCGAAFQMLYDYSKRKYPDGRYPPAVVSLPTGCTRDKDGKGVIHKTVLAKKDFFTQFEEVILCLDQDGPGQAVTAAFSDWLGSDLVKVMVISEKDSNDMLLADKENEFINSFFKAGKYRPKALITVADVYDDAIKMPEYGRPWPWPNLTKATYGRREGEGYYIGAGTKIGKTEFLNQLGAYIVNEEDNMPLIVKGEEIPSLTSKKIAGKIFEKNFHDPTGNFLPSELIKGIDYVKDKFFMYDYRDGIIWEDVKFVIRTAVQEGTRDVFIDPITCFTDGITNNGKLLTAGEVDSFLKFMVRELDNMAKDLGFTYYVFCHLNAPPKGSKPHEEGGRVRSNQFTGSRVMMRACSYMIGLERNKQEEDEILRNTTMVRLLEDRMFGNSAFFPIFYDRQTGLYLEPTDDGEGEV